MPKMTTKLTLNEWLRERYENCIRVAASAPATDKAGWLEDATYFAHALNRLDRKDAETRQLAAFLVNDLLEATSDRARDALVDMFAASLERNRLNSGNLNYTPYQVEERKS